MTLACTTAGTGGTPIVFVHGIACAREDWQAQVEHFSAARQEIACDLPGHGASPGKASECNIERYGKSLAELLVPLSAPALLVGHSMGCRVVLEAHRMPASK